MQLTFECPKCRLIDHVDMVGSASQALCRHCHTNRELAPGSFDAGGAPVACPICSSADLYIHQDFPQEIGLAILLAGFAASLVIWYYGSPRWAYLTLGASLLMDLALYRLVPDVLVCYHCGSQIRGQDVNRGRRFRPYDLTTGERYRREPLRAEGPNSGGASAEPGGPAPRPDAT